MAFVDNEQNGLTNLNSYFPHASFKLEIDAIQQNAFNAIKIDNVKPNLVKLHLKGTDFQLKVWEALLKIPMGQLSTYGKIANEIQNPNATRAVGTAIGSNPVAYLIPCHRVIQSSGIFGGYMWGSARKAAMIGWEAAKTNL